MKAKYWPWIGVKADGVGDGSSGMKIAFLPDFAGRNGEVNVRYRVELSEAERAELKGLVSRGKRAVRRLKRAQILLASDVGQTEEATARILRMGFRRCIGRGVVLWKAISREP